MNRRGFLGLLLGGAAGLVLDPERLLWVPGQKTIFLPSVTAPCPFEPFPEVGRVLINNLQFANNVWCANIDGAGAVSSGWRLVHW